MCRRNHGSIAVASATRSTVHPRRNASPRCQSRSAFGRRNRSSTSSSLDSRRGSNPWLSISSERIAFCNDSLNVRPIAIASPTDFICGPSVSLACGNFSNVKRGILVTT